MSQITDGLTTKIGPLPAWAYGLGIGATIVGVRWYRNRSTPAPVTASDGAATGTGANTVTATDAALTSTPGTVGGYTMPTGYQYNPGGVIDHTGQDTTGAGTGPQSQDDWTAQAYNVLISRGYNAVSVTEAIRKYLAGEPVTSSEEGMIGVALREVGPVPGGAPALTRAAPAPVVQPPDRPTQTIPIPAPIPAPGGGMPVPVPQPKPAGRPLLRKGDTGPAVSALALWLNVNASGTAFQAEHTGVFDDTLELALGNFQSITGIPRTNVTDPTTWAKIEEVAKLRGSPIPAY